MKKQSLLVVALFTALSLLFGGGCAKTQHGPQHAKTKAGVHAQHHEKEKKKAKSTGKKKAKAAAKKKTKGKS